ncbi:hypothetical protein KKA39_00840 [Patescibacteria group bacterium]|nr:hypothetical protein [Patescibacteria group bacterium]MBU1727842.1 hypothetical protein [Patescibacteria group bacterium]
MDTDPELRQLLQSTLNTVEENNKMLRHIRRSQKMASFVRFLYWIFIIGIAIGAFYFLQPYVDNITNFFKETGSTFDSIKGVLPK